MLALGRRFSKPGLAGLLLLALACSSARAQDVYDCPSEARGTYVGIFGGGGCSNITNVSQLGVALFPDIIGGPLDVHATGGSDSRGIGLVGLQIGHEWSRGSWLPAVELEGFYFTGTQHATVDNPTTRLPEHVFDDSFPMDNFAFLTNVVLSFETRNQSIKPYVGIGFGTACITINGANSPQVGPPEPGVNHFNSGTDSSSWGFATQAKIGLRFHLTERAYVFAEYRYLYVGSTTYIFGSTVSPGHAATSLWTVRFSDLSSHLGVGGIGFSF